MVNEQFGTSYTPIQIGSNLKNWGIKTGAPRCRPEGYRKPMYPKDVDDFIKSHYEGVGWGTMKDMVNEKFGTSYTTSQIKGYYGRNHLNSGVTGRFEKGRTPFNKGMPRERYMSPEALEKSKATQFKKGRLPHGTRPIGYERRGFDGYIEVKVKMRPQKSNDNFKLKHRIIWEQAYGPIPEGCIVAFKDGDKSNVSLENLMLITRAQNAVMNRFHYRKKEPELAETSVLLADIKSATRKKKEEIREKRKTSRKKSSEQ